VGTPDPDPEPVHADSILLWQPTITTNSVLGMSTYSIYVGPLTEPQR